MKYQYAVTHKVRTKAAPQWFPKTLVIAGNNAEGAEYRAWTDLRTLGFEVHTHISTRRIA